VRCCIRFILALAVAMSLAACASSPRTSASVPITAALRLAPEEELVAIYGKQYQENPYIAPWTVLLGRPEEFIVLRLELSTPAATAVELDVRAADADGREVASFRDRENMKQYCAMYGAEAAEIRRRFAILDRSCAPSDAFKVRAGVSVYYIVLMGKRPLPETRLRARVLVDGGIAASLDETLEAGKAEGKPLIKF
jgi:hypothetical protein